MELKCLAHETLAYEPHCICNLPINHKGKHQCFCNLTWDYNAGRDSGPRP